MLPLWSFQGTHEHALAEKNRPAGGLSKLSSVVNTEVDVILGEFPTRRSLSAPNRPPTTSEGSQGTSTAETPTGV